MTQTLSAADDPPQSQEEYLSALLKRLIDQFTAKRRAARAAARAVKLLLITLGGVTTVLIGLREFTSFSAFGETMGVIALVLSALATGLTAWDGFNNSGWKWAHYRDMLLRLYTIRDHLAFDKMGPDGITDDICQGHFDALQGLLSEDREKWQSVRATAITGRKR